MSIKTHGRAASPQVIAEPAKPGVEWLRLNDVRATYGMGRSLVYELIAEGHLRSVSLQRPGRSRGLRLVSAESIRAYILAAAAVTEGGH